MPVLARVYGVSPFEQHRLTLGQLNSIRADYERLQAEVE